MACRCEFRKKLLEKLKTYSNDNDEIYLDNCATTKPDKSTAVEFEKASFTYWANPSSYHPEGIKAYNYLQHRIEIIKKALKIENQSVFFTSSGSDAMIRIIKELKNYKAFSSIITTNIEHKSVYDAIHLSNSIHKTIDFTTGSDNTITLNLAMLKKTLQDNPDSILIYSPVNHETGILQPIEEIHALAKKFNTPVIIDGVQTITRLHPEKWLLYCDIFTISAHKLYSPKGTAMIGFTNDRFNHLFDNENTDSITNSPFFEGTVNVPGIAAFSRAIENYFKNINDNIQHIKALITDLRSILSTIDADIYINDNFKKAPGILNISLTGINDFKKLIEFLFNNGISISRFSACSNEINGPSKILSNLGFDDKKSSSSLRISVSHNNKRSDFYKFKKVLSQAHALKI